jgi:muramoyltetrapeptide carboxypeptidase
MARTLENARQLGWEPLVAEHARERTGYLAGSDADRLADLNRAAADDAIDAVWCLRGGYGCTRLLDGIDYAAWRRRPKALIGYSDITALHAAIGSRADLVTFHGPTARSALSPFTLDSLRAAVALGVEPCGVAAEARTLFPGRARGPLVGGNLALLSALSGTPYAPWVDGAILILEDVNEPVYRIDRMLTQLRLSGAIGRCKGVVFGGFTDIPPDPDDHERSLEVVLAEFAETVRLPCIASAPIGHVADYWTVPLGAVGVLDAEERALTVERT